MKTMRLILVFSLFFVFGCSKKSEDIIKIGAILPLTGDGAKYGEADKNGFELALEDIGYSNIEIIYEDDQGTSKGAINAFNKLVQIDHVPVIIGLMYSSTALSVAPLGNEKKIVLFSTTASSPELTFSGEYFFRNWPSDVYEGSKMAEFAYNNLKIKSAAIVAVNLDYGVGLTKVFVESFEGLGGKIVATEYYNQGTVDFRTQLNKIKQTKVDAIYLPGYYTEIGLLLRQAKEIDLKAQFLSCVGFDDPKVLEIASNAAENLIFARPYYDPQSKDSLVISFVKKYKIKFGKEPGIYAAHAYDALKIIAQAIDIGGSSPEGIRLALSKIKNFKGVTGLTSFDKNGDVIKPIQFMMVVNNRFVEYQEATK